VTVTAPEDDRDRVGPYRVIAAIGAGGSARIDLARLERAYGFERHVVIKRPLEHLRADPAVSASLRQEARLGGRLRHPNLVAVLDAGTHDAYDYLALEYVHGAPLRRVMAAGAPDRVRALPLGVALGIAIDIARGLHHAHELTDGGAPLGLVHRDVAPANVLVGVDGAVKLADFGIAKETQVSTLSGSMRGTVTYMAPEQCQGHPFDRRADVFSLGVILFELVTHRRLFHADNDVASLHRVLSGVVPRPRELNAAVPRELEDIVLTAVARDAAKRFATAGELAAALEGVAARHAVPVGARWIARAVEQVLGRPAEPWRMRAPAAVPPGLVDEGPLVGVIESLVGEDDEPTVVDEQVWPTFGPTDAGADAAAGEDAVTDRAVAPRGRRRAIAIATIAGAAVAAGALVIALGIGNRGDVPAKPAPEPARAPAPITSPTPPEPAPAPITSPDFATPAPVPAPASAPADEPRERDAGTTRSTKRRRDRASAATPVESPAPGPGSGSTAAAGSGSGSGSAAAPARTDKPTETPVWAPDLLLPGDRRGSGSGR
jgi:hypothetical protein